MTTFKEIRGTAVESVSSDPTNSEVGQLWYNNSIGVLKGYAFTPAAWANPTVGKVIQIGNRASFFSYNNTSFNRCISRKCAKGL